MSRAPDLFRLDGKVALVTGGGRGLGWFAAEGLAESGAQVILCGRNAATLTTARERLQAAGHRCLDLVCDVSREEEVQAIAARVEDEFGHCDVLVNNAGIGAIVPSQAMTLDAWNEIMQTNLAGTFLCCREIGKGMIERGGGSIINFSSENGQVGFSFGMTAYATSKIGIIGLTRSLAVEWGGHGVRVNALLPGNMEEGMMAWLKDHQGPMYQSFGPPTLALTPLGRFGNGDDIKGAVVFLASDASAYISGAKLVVDGGFTVNAGL